MAQFLDGLRRLITVDDMPDERRVELLGLVDHLDAATQRADREVLRRSWERARCPLQAAGPTLNYVMARLAIPLGLDAPAVMNDRPAPLPHPSPGWGRGTV